MKNLELWDKVREVPENAQKTIGGGRLKGMTDINPVWRIKTLTENFGLCGVGWKYEITDKRLEEGGRCDRAAFVDIKLYIKVDGEWSEAIPGTGGSMFIQQERDGLHTSDEAFKMALTDAISVACKALGIGADVYWEADKTKYGNQTERTAPQTGSNEPKKGAMTGGVTDKQLGMIKRLGKDLEQFGLTPAYPQDESIKMFKKEHSRDLTKAEASQLIESLMADVDKGKHGGFQKPQEPDPDYYPMGTEQEETPY